MEGSDTVIYTPPSWTPGPFPRDVSTHDPGPRCTVGSVNQKSTKSYSWDTNHVKRWSRGRTTERKQNEKKTKRFISKETFFSGGEDKKKDLCFRLSKQGCVTFYCLVCLLGLPGSESQTQPTLHSTPSLSFVDFFRPVHAGPDDRCSEGTGSLWRRQGVGEGRVTWPLGKEKGRMSPRGTKRWVWWNFKKNFFFRTIWSFSPGRTLSVLSYITSIVVSVMKT